MEKKGAIKIVGRTTDYSTRKGEKVKGIRIKIRK
jgi:hypothetical protein